MLGHHVCIQGNQPQCVGRQRLIELTQLCVGSFRPTVTQVIRHLREQAFYVVDTFCRSSDSARSSRTCLEERCGGEADASRARGDTGRTECGADTTGDIGDVFGDSQY